MTILTLLYTINKSLIKTYRIDSAAVEKLFAGLMAVIIAISIYNCFSYAGVILPLFSITILKCFVWQ